MEATYNPCTGCIQPYTTCGECMFREFAELLAAGQLVVLPKELIAKENFIPKLARAFTNHFCPAEFGLNDEQCGNWRPYDIVRCYKSWEVALKECNIK